MLYVSISLTIRSLQGFASATLSTCCFSIVTNFYPNGKEELVGYMEAFTGIGLVVGPIVGSVLYTLLGFSMTFFIFGSIFVLVSIFILRVLPPLIDKD